MIPGEVITPDRDIELNVGRETLKITVANTGDRPIQIGSHFHFYEANDAFRFMVGNLLRFFFSLIFKNDRKLRNQISGLMRKQRIGKKNKLIEPGIHNLETYTSIY